jgi:peptidylprolyl isomerase domain and WD repeat-containing protein 1
MHKTNVTVVRAQPQNGGFVVSGSSDGYVKFWKKTTDNGQIEFVKQFRAHADSPVVDAVFSADGRSLAVISTEKTVKIFDVNAFDMIGILDIPFVPSAVAWTVGTNIAL